MNSTGLFHNSSVEALNHALIIEKFHSWSSFFEGISSSLNATIVMMEEDPAKFAEQINQTGAMVMKMIAMVVCIYMFYRFVTGCWCQ